MLLAKLSHHYSGIPIDFVHYIVVCISGGDEDIGKVGDAFMITVFVFLLHLNNLLMLHW